MATDRKSTKSPYNAEKSSSDILANFQALRSDQRMMIMKLSEMEMEQNEHKIVIDTLKGVNPKRKCFRMIGGILCERIVGDVLPGLVSNNERLTKVIASLHENIEKKGEEINDFKDKNNIKIRGIDELQKTDDDSKEMKQNFFV